MDSDWQGMFVHGLGLLAHTYCRGTGKIQGDTCGHQSLCREMQHTLLSKSASVGVVFISGIIFFKMCKRKKIGGWTKIYIDLGKT